MRDERDAGIFRQFLFTLNHGNGPIVKQREDILSAVRPSRSSLGRLDVIKPHTEDRTGLTRFHKAGKDSIRYSVVVTFKYLECKHTGEVPMAIYLHSVSWWMSLWSGVPWSTCSCSVLLRATSWSRVLYLLATVATNTDVCSLWLCKGTRSWWEQTDSYHTLAFCLLFAFFYDIFPWYFIICLTQTRGQRSDLSTEKVQGSSWQPSTPSNV